MPIDFTKPATTGNYSTGVLQPIVDAHKALAQWLDPAVAGTLTSPPTGAKRYSGGAMQQYNGSSWVALPLKADTLVTARNFTLTGVAVTAAVSFDGSANVTLNVTGVPATLLTGTINAARLPGTIDSNTTGSAASAASVAWAGVSGRPTALLDFTNNGTFLRGTVNTWISDSAGAGRLHWSSGSLSYYKAATNSGTCHMFRRANDGQLMTIDASGNVVATADVTGFSDDRLKKNWRGFGADFVERLAAVKHGVYDRVDQQITQVGVSAQSLREVMPQAVHTDDSQRLSVAYGNAALAAAVALAGKVVGLERRVRALEPV